MSQFRKEKNRFIFLMLMPATILLVGLTLFPFIVSFILSFTDYSLLRPGQTKFIFLNNYIELMTTDEFWIALRVTLVFTILAVFIQVVLGVTFATLLHNENTNVSNINGNIIPTQTIDGIEIPIINHFGTQGSGGGPAGILNVLLIEDVRLSTSAFDAKYDNPTCF